MTSNRLRRLGLTSVLMFGGALVAGGAWAGEGEAAKPALQPAPPQARVAPPTAWRGPWIPPYAPQAYPGMYGGYPGAVWGGNPGQALALGQMKSQYQNQRQQMERMYQTQRQQMAQRAENDPKVKRHLERMDALHQRMMEDQDASHEMMLMEMSRSAVSSRLGAAATHTPDLLEEKRRLQKKVMAARDNLLKSMDSMGKDEGKVPILNEEQNKLHQELLSKKEKLQAGLSASQKDLQKKLEENEAKLRTMRMAHKEDGVKMQQDLHRQMTEDQKKFLAEMDADQRKLQQDVLEGQTRLAAMLYGGGSQPLPPPGRLSPDQMKLHQQMVEDEKKLREKMNAEQKELQQRLSENQRKLRESMSAHAGKPVEQKVQ